MSSVGKNFWEGFFKCAAMPMHMPHLAASRGMFSRGGIQQAVKHNPLPSEGMVPMKTTHRYAKGRGVGSMPVP